MTLVLYHHKIYIKIALNSMSKYYVFYIGGKNVLKSCTFLLFKSTKSPTVIFFELAFLTNVALIFYHTF